MRNPSHRFVSCDFGQWALTLINERNLALSHPPELARNSISVEFYMVCSGGATTVQVPIGAIEVLILLLKRVTSCPLCHTRYKHLVLQDKAKDDQFSPPSPKARLLLKHCLGWGTATDVLPREASSLLVQASTLSTIILLGRPGISLLASPSSSF